MNSPSTYLKAIYAGATAGLGALSTVLVDHPSVELRQWVAIASTTIVAFGATYGVSNAPAVARRVRRRQAPARAGRVRDASGRYLKKGPPAE